MNGMKSLNMLKHNLHVHVAFGFSKWLKSQNTGYSRWNDDWS